jgi:hypothetical protein
LADEARLLAAQGIKEITLVAQDTTGYGDDLGMNDGLADLLEVLDKVDGIEWIRFLYTYPDAVSDKLIRVINESEKICRYIDMPLQHASAAVLKSMRRGGSRARLARMIERIRRNIPDVTLRTTFIVGFPGETGNDFRELKDFCREMEFDRMGVFTYSDEEDTPAFGLRPRVSARTAKARQRILMERQAEIAALPVMKDRLKKWYALNDAELDTPLVTVEFNGPPEEIFPPLKCESPLACEVENQIQQNIRNHELIGDDRVIPNWLSIGVPNWIVPFGIRTERIHSRYPDGRQSMGYAVQHIIDDLEKDFDKLGKTETHVDAGLKEAAKKQAEIEELLGGVLPVRMQFSSFGFSLVGVFLTSMGMQNMMTSLYDYPELFHRLMNTLTEDYLRFMDAIEASGAITYSGGAGLGQGSWCYTNDLPAEGNPEGRPAGFADVWGYTNSQETVGISPEMFDEFFFSYMDRITGRLGLLSYGCCEPVDGLRDSCLSRLPNLRKLSISAWCREEEIAEKIRGKKIVYHRKPRATYIGVDPVFDEESFAGHIAKSVKAATGCPLEITFREELTTRGEPWRLTRAVEIVREQFLKYWKP